jgi:hypothetical protein
MGKTQVVSSGLQTAPSRTSTLIGIPAIACGCNVTKGQSRGAPGVPARCGTFYMRSVNGTTQRGGAPLCSAIWGWWRRCTEIEGEKP